MTDQLIANIIQNPLFLRLKAVVENNPWHDHESVYDHLVKTKDIARREIRGDFITNPKAKKLFEQFANKDFHGMKKANLMVVGALLHDIGKLETPQLKDDGGTTSAPGHEYQGFLIADKFLKDLNLKPEQIKYISEIIRLHGVFQRDYLFTKKGWTIQDIVEDMRGKADGLYIESMFNNYCDVFTADPFQPFKETVIKIFNEPKLYV